MKRFNQKSAHEYSKVSLSTRRGAFRKGGFTLIELLVVVAIAAILSALLLGGFVNISSSNKRTSCQVNLQQIYGALKMYTADADGAYPYYNASPSNGGVGNSFPVDTVGLWKLYTTTSNVADVAISDTPTIFTTVDGTVAGAKKPLGIYLKNSGNLHCPADYDDAHASLYRDTPPGDPQQLNPGYLSYQTIDNGAGVPGAFGSNTATYQSQRTVTYADGAVWKRQLMFWDGTQRIYDQRPASDTVITWCKWHRTGLGGRNLDPILFADGSIKSKPLGALPGWQRTND